MMRQAARRLARSTPVGATAGTARALTSRAPQVPTAAEAEAMPRHVSQLSGEALFILAQTGTGHAGAARERLRREIMHVDEVDYFQAGARISELAKVNTENLNLARAPYFVGIGTALVSGWASIPLVFNKWTAKHFNEIAVTTDVPETSDLETMLEVGMWSWGWMEPPLGTISFFILCMQYSRDQRINLGLPLFTQRYQDSCAAKLEKAFPQYDRLVVRDYAKVMAFDVSDVDGVDDEVDEASGRKTTAKSSAAAASSAV